MLKCMGKNISKFFCRLFDRTEKKMKKILSLVLALSLLLGSALVLTSCGAPKDEGAYIPVYLGEPIYDFDPTDYYVDSNADQLMSLLFEPLFTVNDNGKLKKAAADKYEVDEEERTITIDIRETYWSDGSRVLASDFIYAWRDVILDPTKSNPAAALLYDIENAAEIKKGEVSAYEFGATGSLYELKIVYREGADYEQLLMNLASVATAPLRQNGVAQSSSYWAKSVNTIYTNGPFSVDTLDYDDGILTLTRNLGYHQNPNKVDYDNVVNPHVLASTFEVSGKTVDLTYSDIEEKVVFVMTDASLADRSANADEAKVYDDLSTYTYVFDTTNPLFAKKEVRQALSLVIDRNAIINAITFGKAADGFIAPLAAEDIEQSLISASAKKAEAEQLLSGVDFTGISKSFTLTVNNDEESIAIAEIVEAAWESIGFNVTVKAVGTVKNTVIDFANSTDIDILDSEIQYLVKEASKGNVQFDVIAVDWQMYSTDPFVALAALTSDMNGCGASFDGADSTLRSNISGWSSAEYDALIKSAYGTANDEARNGYLKDAEKLLMEEMPIIPLVFNETFVFTAKGISKVKVDGLGNLDFTDVKLKKYEKYLPAEEE